MREAYRAYRQPECYCGGDPCVCGSWTRGYEEPPRPNYTIIVLVVGVVLGVICWAVLAVWLHGVSADVDRHLFGVDSAPVVQEDRP